MLTTMRGRTWLEELLYKVFSTILLSPSSAAMSLAQCSHGSFHGNLELLSFLTLGLWLSKSAFLSFLRTLLSISVTDYSTVKASICLCTNGSIKSITSFLIQLALLPKTHIQLSLHLVTIIRHSSEFSYQVIKSICGQL